MSSLHVRLNFIGTLATKHVLLAGRTGANFWIGYRRKFGPRHGATERRTTIADSEISGPLDGHRVLSHFDLPR